MQALPARARRGTFYSGTNVQVEGVDEGDIVKTDGKYIYILRGSEMVVMQADGKDVTDVSNVFVGQDWEQTTTEDGLAHTQEKLPTELYLSGSPVLSLSRPIPTGRIQAARMTR